MAYCSFCKMEYPGNGACTFCGKRNTSTGSSASSVVRDQIRQNRADRNQTTQNFQDAHARARASIREMNRSSKQYTASHSGKEKKSSIGGRLIISAIVGLLAASFLGSNSIVFWIVAIIVFLCTK